MSPRYFICTLSIIGLLVLAGCSPKPTPAANPTTVGQTTPFQMNNLDQYSADPLIMPMPSELPPNTSAPIAVNPAINPSVPTVNAAPGMLIQQFNASPGDADPGGAVMLTWRTSGSKVNLQMLRADSTVLNTWEGLAQQGAITVTAPDLPRDTVGFVLTTEAGGATETSSITVHLRCGDAWFFSLPPEGCPAQSAFAWAGVAQPFEHGLMVFVPANAVSANNMVYVLFDDGSMVALNDTWQNGMLIEDAAIIPPTGFFEPTRSFGLVWRDPAAAEMDIRAKLGWATGAEIQYEARYQCDSTSSQVCYLQGPSGLLVIEPMNAGWHVWWGESVR